MLGTNDPLILLFLHMSDNQKFSQRQTNTVQQGQTVHKKATERHIDKKNIYPITQIHRY